MKKDNTDIGCQCTEQACTTPLDVNARNKLGLGYFTLGALFQHRLIHHLLFFQHNQQI